MVKFLSTALLIGSFVFGLVPAAYARGTQAQAKEKSAKTDPTLFCSSYSELETKVEALLTESDKMMLAKRTETEDRLRSEWAAQDEKKAEARSKADISKEAQFASLMNRAKTEAQKTAVTTYENKINAAVTQRRSTVDAAIAVYRDEALKIYESQKNAIDGSVASFKTALSSALAKAQTDCTLGIAPTEIKARFKVSLETARAKLKTDKEFIGALNKKIAALGSTRTEAIAKAKTDFQKAIEDAGTVLKAFLPTTKK